MRESGGNDVAGEQKESANKGHDIVSSEQGDGEENGGDEEGVGNGKNEQAFEVSAPEDRAPAFGVHPGHIFGKQDADGNAGHWNDGDQRGTEEAAEDEIAALDGRGKNNLKRVVAEIAGSGGIHKRGDHQEGEQADDGVIIFDDERGVVEGVGEGVADDNMV